MQSVPTFSSAPREPLDGGNAHQSPDRMDHLKLILSALDHTQEAYLILTPSQHNEPCHILYTNPAFCRLTGFKEDEIRTQGAAWLEQTEINQHLQTGRNDLASHVPFTRDFLFRRKDGSSLWAELQLVPVQAGQDWSTHWVGIIRDITNRKQTEQSLVESQMRLNGILNSLSDVIWSMDLAMSKFIYLSPATDRLLGRTVQEFFDQPKLWWSMIHPDDSVRVFAAFADVENIGGFELDYRIVRPNGEIRWLRNKAQVIYDEQQQPKHLDGIADDITAHKTTENRVERMANFSRFNPNPIYELTGNGELTFFNEAAGQLALSLGNSKAAEILPWETNQIVQECLRTGKPKLRLETNYGERTISWSYFPIPRTDIVHCYAGEITERIKLEAQLRQSEKLKTVGQLAGGVAHDFNNILTIISGFTNLLLARGDTDEEATDQLKQVAAAASKAADLTKQLLLFSRRQVLQTKTFNLATVVSDLAKMLKRLLGEDVQLNVEELTPEPYILADQGMIEQIIVNLASNARDAMPRGGILTLRTEIVSINSAQAKRNPDARVGQFVCLSSIDTGSGMDATTIQHIFEPFFTTKLPGKGTGLGLSTVYGITRQHEGWVEVQSEIGLGTTFSIYLPMAQNTTVGEAPRVPTEQKASGGTETILVVEDEAPLRSLLRGILRAAGYRIIEAKHGLEALRKWDEHHEEIDLLLTDLVMPGTINGIDLAERLLSENEELKVIFSSGYSADVVGEKLAFDPGTNFLAKPYMPAQLLKMVRTCLDQPKIKS